jgi:hypothetical protein
MALLFPRLPRTLLVAATLAACLLVAASSRAQSAPPFGDFRVNTVTDQIQQSSAVAMHPSGNFVVAWQSEIEGSGDDIRARRFDARGFALGDEFPVNVLTQGNQVAPSLAMDAKGAFVVVWQSLLVSHYVIRARCFDERGVPKGDEIAVDARPRENHNAPVVAISPDGRFVVAWESAIQGSYQIRARRFDSQGKAQGGEFSVHAVTQYSQRFPDVAMDARGNFVVVWRSNVARSFEIRAQRFAASGAAAGGEIVVNTQTAGDQLAPSIAMASEGGFVVTWENSLDQSVEIRARRFSARGVPLGGEFSANAATAGSQFAPAVAIAENGDFVIVWHSQLGLSSEIRGRAFASTGEPLSRELAVNTLTSGTQKSAAVALDRLRNLVVSWHSDGSGNWDVVARKHRMQLEPAQASRSRCCDRNATKRR